MIFSYILALILATSAGGQEVPLSISSSAVLPTYISLAPTINDFNRFADGGPDGNWYVGFNNAWIVRLPAAPYGDFSRAFVGAKIGRAKTRPNANKPWLRETIDGKVYIGISQAPAFTSEQSFFLAETSDIPLDGDPHAFVEGVGGGEWFWAEIPVAMVSFTRPNYLIVWSPTKYFVRASSAPIIAAAADDWGAAEPRAWNNHSIQGVPPRSTAGTLETPIKNMNPALAIKLVPRLESEVSVGDFSFRRAGRKTVVEFSVAGQDVAEAWVEISRDQLDWVRASRLQRKQPYAFTLASEKLPPGSFLRGAARDSLGAVGYSSPTAVPYAPR